MKEIKKGKVIVFGGASVDCTFYGTESGYRDEPDVSVAGGKGANQAVACARAGVETAIICMLGADGMGGVQDKTRDAIIENLKRNKVDVSKIESKVGVDNDSCNIYIDYVSKDNDIQRTTGAINNFTIDMIEKNKEQLKNAAFVIAQMKIPKEVSVELINFCHENNVPIIITPCRPDKLKISEPGNLELIEKIDYITCNEKEFHAIFGDISVEEGVKKYPYKLIVTLGEKGAMYYNGEKIIYKPAMVVNEVVDTTGAGDTLNGNFVAALIQGYSYEDALTRGMAASALKIQKETAQLGMPTKDELDNFLLKKTIV